MKKYLERLRGWRDVRSRLKDAEMALQRSRDLLSISEQRLAFAQDVITKQQGMIAHEGAEAKKRLYSAERLLNAADMMFLGPLNHYEIRNWQFAYKEHKMPSLWNKE